MFIISLPYIEQTKQGAKTQKSPRPGGTHTRQDKMRMVVQTIQQLHQTRDVRWSKFAGTGKEINAFLFKKDISLSRFFSFFLFLRTGLSFLSYLSWD